MRANAGDLAQRIVARNRAEMPELFPDGQSVEVNLSSAEAGVRQLADIVEVTGDPRGIDLPAPTVAIARAAVQRQIPLVNFMRFYRVAQDVVWQWMCARVVEASADSADQATALKLATSWLFGYLDAAMLRAEQVYEAEWEAWVRGAAAARTAAIDDILAERERDPQRASKRLRYDINRHHVGMIAWMDSLPEDRDDQPILAEALTNLADRIGAETTLVQPTGWLAAAGWLSRRSAFEPAALDAVTMSGKSALPQGLRVGVGDQGHGLKGFRRSHMEAAHARLVASLSGTHAGVLTRYRDVAVAALAAACTRVSSVRLFSDTTSAAVCTRPFQRTACASAVCRDCRAFNAHARPLGLGGVRLGLGSCGPRFWLAAGARWRAMPHRRVG